MGSLASNCSMNTAGVSGPLRSPGASCLVSRCGENSDWTWTDPGTFRSYSQKLVAFLDQHAALLWKKRSPEQVVVDREVPVAAAADDVVAGGGERDLRRRVDATDTSA